MQLHALVTKRKICGRYTDIDFFCGRLPLHRAVALKASSEVVVALLGAYPEAMREEDNSGRLPVDLAISQRLPTETVDTLRAASGLGIAVERGDWAALVEFDLVTPEACRETDGNGRLPLHRAVVNQASSEAVGALLGASDASAARKR